MKTHEHKEDHAGHARRHDDVKPSKGKNPFFIPFILILIFAVIELYAGVWTQSLALVSDAWHMFSDVFALGLAMLASFSVRNLATKTHGHTTFELIASIINVLLMVVVIIWIVIEAIERLQHPQAIASASTYMMAVALLGLVINIIVAKRLHTHGHDHDAHDNLNHRAALLHVLGDILGSVAALVAGAVIFFTGWLPIDPILSMLISVLLSVGTLRLIQDIWRTITR